jgi:hypothetical protein
MLHPVWLGSGRSGWLLYSLQTSAVCLQLPGVGRQKLRAGERRAGKLADVVVTSETRRHSSLATHCLRLRASAHARKHLPGPRVH